MHDAIVGALAVAVGSLFCFRGYLAMRLIIPMWGAFAGFLLGAGLVDATSDDRFLRSVLGWIVGIAVVILFALIAYRYYEVSVVLGMAAIGFALGTTETLGDDWWWYAIYVAVAIAGIVVQIRHTERLSGTLREQWVGAGGREMRAN